MAELAADIETAMEEVEVEALTEFPERSMLVAFSDSVTVGRLTEDGQLLYLKAHAALHVPKVFEIWDQKWPKEVPAVEATALERRPVLYNGEAYEEFRLHESLAALLSEPRDS